MFNWRDNEIIELLSIRGREDIRTQITGTVKDSVVYNRMVRLLAERGVHRSHMQVVSKLKTLKRQYAKAHQQKARCGIDRTNWPFYEQCHSVFGNSAVVNPVRRPGTPTATPTATPSPTPPACSEYQEVEVHLWDEASEEEKKPILAPVEEDEEEQEQASASDSLQSPGCTVPPKKKKKTKTEQTADLLSTMMFNQLTEMDAAMEAQEDARLQRLMDHERELQNSLMTQLMAMQERISRENHERQLQLMDRLLSRLPAPSPPGPSRP
ncbi:uncharacterized protein LOC139914764 [Centroberyx gerrardi]